MTREADAFRVFKSLKQKSALRAAGARVKKGDKTMIILFAICFGAGLVMMFTGFVRSVAVHSGVLSRFDNSALAHRVRKSRLRRHWLITYVLLGIAVYAGMHL